MKKLYIITVMIFLFGTSVSATALPLSGPYVEAYNQQDSPCFIGYSCGPNLGIDVTTYSALDQDTQFSPLYQGTQLALLKSLVGNTPYIAIDINQEQSNDTTKLYLVDYVKVFFNGATDPAYQFGPQTDPWLQQETGNGVSDYVLKGLDLTGATTSLRFEVQYGNFDGSVGDNNDGKELFFLVEAGIPQVPEPSALFLLGAGLVLVGFIRRKTHQK